MTPDQIQSQTVVGNISRKQTPKGHVLFCIFGPPCPPLRPEEPQAREQAKLIGVEIKTLDEQSAETTKC